MAGEGLELPKKEAVKHSQVELREPCNFAPVNKDVGAGVSSGLTISRLVLNKCKLSGGEPSIGYVKCHLRNLATSAGGCEKTVIRRVRGKVYQQRLVW